MTAQDEKKEYRKNVPELETRVRLSQDRKWVISQTVLTDIRPATYFERMLVSWFSRNGRVSAPR